MLRIQVLGRGLIPRGLGLAPRKEPFAADLPLIYTILNTPGLIVNMVHPDGRLIKLTRSNCKNMFDKYKDKTPYDVKLKEDVSKEDTTSSQPVPGLSTPDVNKGNVESKEIPHNEYPTNSPQALAAIQNNPTSVSMIRENEPPFNASKNIAGLTDVDNQSEKKDEVKDETPVNNNEKDNSSNKDQNKNSTETNASSKKDNKK